MLVNETFVSDAGKVSVTRAPVTPVPPVFETTIVGTRAYTWNGRTRAGRRLASGLYVVALTTPYGVYHSPLHRVR